jgi:hypothetical protein
LSAVSRRLSSGARSVPPSLEALAKLRLNALRRGVWLRDLKQGERKLSLTISNLLLSNGSGPQIDFMH